VNVVVVDNVVIDIANNVPEIMYLVIVVVLLFRYVMLGHL